MGEPGFPTVPYHTVRQTTRWPPQPTKSVRRLGFPRRHLDTPLNSVVATRYLQYFTHRPSDVYRFAHVSERGAPLFACQFQPSTASSRPLVAATNEEGTLFLVDAKSSSQWVDGTTGVGNVQPAEQVFTSWSAHGNAIFDVQWSQDGRQLLTASGDQTVKLWDVERQIDVAMFPAHDASVKSVSWSFQNPFTFASAGRDGKIVIWDQRCASTVNDHNQRVHRPGDIIHAAHSVRDLANPRSIGAGTQRLNATLLRAAGAMKKPLHGRLGTRGRGSGRIPVLSGMRQSRRKTNARPLANNGQSVTAVLYMPHRDHCVASAGVVNSTVKYWDTRQLGRHMNQAPPTPWAESACSGAMRRPRGVSSLAVSPDGTRLFALAADHRVYMYNSFNISKPLMSFADPSFRCDSFYVKMSVSPDSQFLAAGSSDHTVHVWPIPSHPSMQSPPALKLHSHTKEVGGVAWSRTRIDQLASCSDDGSLRLWSVNQTYNPRRSTDSTAKDGVQEPIEDMGYSKW